MFAKPYIIRVYSEGNDQVIMSFNVNAILIEVKDHHTLNIDSILLRFGDKHYVTAERVYWKRPKAL